MSNPVSWGQYVVGFLICKWQKPSSNYFKRKRNLLASVVDKDTDLTYRIKGTRSGMRTKDLTSAHSFHRSSVLTSLSH